MRESVKGSAATFLEVLRAAVAMEIAEGGAASDASAWGALRQGAFLLEPAPLTGPPV